MSSKRGAIILAMDLALESRIEAILFWKGEPVALDYLSQALAVPLGEIELAIESLASSLSGRGLTLIRKEAEVTLGTRPEFATLFEKLTKEELAGELSRPSLETLTIVLYHSPVTRATIDYLRGVNSAFTLRQLQIRGLVERVPNPEDARAFLYRPTFALLGHLGISELNQLPEFASLRAKLAEFAATEKETKEETKLNES